MLVIKSKNTDEVLQTEAPSPFYNIGYNPVKDETQIYAFDSNVLLFTLSGNAEKIRCWNCRKNR